MNKDNPMRKINIEKVTVNIGTGSAGEVLENAKKLLERLTGKKPVETKARKRNPIFKIRVGLPIGVKVTLRGADAENFLKNAFSANKNVLNAVAFDKEGNFSLGVKEYIDFPGAKYDPSLGMFGFDVCVTLKRKGGRRISIRRIKTSKVGKSHRISPEEAKEFIKNKFNINIEEVGA